MYWWLFDCTCILCVCKLASSRVVKLTLNWFYSIILTCDLKHTFVMGIKWNAESSFYLPLPIGGVWRILIGCHGCCHGGSHTVSLYIELLIAVVLFLILSLTGEPSLKVRRVGLVDAHTCPHTVSRRISCAGMKELCLFLVAWRIAGPSTQSPR